MSAFTLVKVEIILDGSETVYQSGQTINGSVNIKFNGELKLPLVSILLKSLSEVELLDCPVFMRQIVGPAVVYKDSEQYLDIEYEFPDNSKC